MASSPWPALRKRTRALASEVYAEAIGELVILAERVLPPPAPGRLTVRAKAGNMLIAWIAFAVACIGRVERLVHGAGGLPVNDIREATLLEMAQGAGALNDKRILPSAYEVWIGPRGDGRLRLRFTYDGARLCELLAKGGDGPPLSSDVCVPSSLDEETKAWVREHVETPAPGTQLAVWRALKKRLYHYDAGVVAFYGFPRNFLLSSKHWAQMLQGRARGTSAVALDVGAGDGSLTMPVQPLFSKIVATELTAPLVCRLRSASFDAVVAEELTPELLGHSQFDSVFILNVLDRCKDPYAMLKQVHGLLAPDGWLIISVVLPASQSDAASSVGGTQRRWQVVGDDFEAGAASLVRDVLRPSHFEPLRIVRAPYFCAGDRYSPVAALDACVMVLRRLPLPDDDAAQTGVDEKATPTTGVDEKASPTVCKPCA